MFIISFFFPFLSLFFLKDNKIVKYFDSQKDIVDKN